MEGENSYLTISSSGINYASIYFMNSLNSIEKLYQYYIFIPDCKNLNYTNALYHSINEDKEGNE